MRERLQERKCRKENAAKKLQERLQERDQRKEIAQNGLSILVSGNRLQKYSGQRILRRRVRIMIDIRNLSKSYNKGQVKAVDGLNLKVNRGELFGFLGPNGAGKTTTIKMIVGLLNPDTGSIAIDGTDIAKEPIEAKRKMGYVPDEPVLYERLTGLEYLNFMADVYRVPASVRKERIERYLDMFNLRMAADLIKSYSHGMRQKTALAALLHDPKLWILMSRW